MVWTFVCNSTVWLKFIWHDSKKEETTSVPTAQSIDLFLRIFEVFDRYLVSIRAIEILPNDWRVRFENRSEFSVVHCICFWIASSSAAIKAFLNHFKNDETNIWLSVSFRNWNWIQFVCAGSDLEYFSRFLTFTYYKTMSMRFQFHQWNLLSISFVIVISTLLTSSDMHTYSAAVYNNFSFSDIGRLRDLTSNLPNKRFQYYWDKSRWRQNKGTIVYKNSFLSILRW